MAKEVTLQVRMDADLKELDEIVAALRSVGNTVYYSMASVWEIAIKHKIRPEEMPVSEEAFVELCVMSV